jgi:hypothetical protein
MHDLTVLSLKKQDFNNDQVDKATRLDYEALPPVVFLIQ